MAELIVRRRATMPADLRDPSGRPGAAISA